MSDILQKSLVLKLNSRWQALGFRTVREAFTDLTSQREDEDRPAALALDLEFGLNPDGTPDHDNLVKASPTEWADWIVLPVRPYDLSIQTSRGEIRVPTILVARNFASMPEKKFKPSGRTIFERDGGKCQVSGAYVGRDRGNLGHIVPRSRGGRITFENAVWIDRQLNTKMGNRTPEEAGMTLIRQPRAPRSVPVSATIREPKHPSQSKFVTR
jgi:hypothetical protein